ncbi:MAG: hypothetical protein U1E72_06835 [Burkholderiaceae bacterium]
MKAALTKKIDSLAENARTRCATRASAMQASRGGDSLELRC